MTMEIFSGEKTLNIHGSNVHFYSVDALQDQFTIRRLPVCLKILLENLLRHEDGKIVTAEQIKAVAQLQPHVKPI